MRYKSSLWLDADNLFGGLAASDMTTAIRFMENPDLWVEELRRRLPTDGDRDWLIRRCYLNPSGSIAFPGSPSERIYFSRFRPHFTRAGFEVVDCPSLAQGAKNGADIRMALEINDALRSDVRIDEFVIGSSDSDFTALLHRLRAQDRQIALLTSGPAVASYRALAHHVLQARELTASNSVYHSKAKLVDPDVSTESAVPQDLEAFRSLATQIYEDADGPINLASFAQTLRAHMGLHASATEWFGNRTFTSALASLNLPGFTTSQHHAWDSRRHTPAASFHPPVDLTDDLSLVLNITGTPLLPPSVWLAVCNAFAEYAGGHEFNLGEATKWTRDRLGSDGISVSRQTIAFILKAASLGGAPLYQTPPPTADEVRQALIKSVVQRAGERDSDVLAPVLSELDVAFGGDTANSDISTRDSSDLVNTHEP